MDNKELESQRFTILIVEDEFALAEGVKTSLHELNYTDVIVSHSVEKAETIIERTEINFAILDVSLKVPFDGIGFGSKISSKNIPYIFLTSYTSDEVLDRIKKNKPAGYLIKPASKKELRTAIELGRYKAAYKSMSWIEKERQFLLDLNSAINHVNDEEAFFSKVVSSLRPLFDLDAPPHLAILTEDEKAVNIKIDTSFPGVSKELIDHILEGVEKFNPIPVTESLRAVILEEEPRVYNVEQIKEMFINDDAHQLLGSTRIQSCMIVPLRIKDKVLGYFNLMSTKEEAFGSAYFDLFKAAANNIATVIQNIVLFNQINNQKEAAEQQKSYLVDEIKSDHHTHDFIGQSPTIQKIREKIEQVANIDTTVLIVGETGTGKELVARAIHNRSNRSSKPMVKINCATLPSQLIESELFGHEKGSFTGADKAKVGKFEMANNGIIFLDEIGELPLDLQPKLLRVIQEKEIVRIGGDRPIALNVKIVAATNRDLLEGIELGNFREDLYYRLNVFPIEIPPLRERRNEIHDLADFFLRKFERKIGKLDLKFSSETLKNLLLYDWPGNIRELQHIIEKEVILTRSAVVNIDEKYFLATSSKKKWTKESHTLKTLRETEREAIIEALKLTKGQVRGKGGAAELLDINASTLESRIKKLEIVKNQIFS